jgi:RNA polymerase sigma-70 factor, ECF subfamily
VFGGPELRANGNAEPVGHDDSFELHRFELAAFCGRIVGPNEAEDAVQETFLRAVRSFDGFEGRSSLRSWLYRIATNICLDMLAARKRRPPSIELVPGAEPVAGEDGRPASMAAFTTSSDGRFVTSASAEEAVIERESVRLAFVAALQHLSPKQRAVLILREVLRWQASEVAELLGTSVAAVNSALGRARTTLRATDASVAEGALDPASAALLAGYVDAFERYDMDALASLLNGDARRSWRGRGRAAARVGDAAPAVTSA